MVSMVVIMVFGPSLVACSTGSQAAVRLEREAAAGVDPFSDSIQMAGIADFPTDIDSSSVDLTVQSIGQAGGGVEIEGTVPGLYGGSNQRSVCDPGKLIRFLDENPDKRSAWASVFGISTDEIASFVGGLTPMILLADTRVTNHGFRDGRARPFQAVLEAGTAVMVDEQGVPRVKCNCGNPLLEPQTLSDPVFEGERWDGFDPGQTVVVHPGVRVGELVAVELESGQMISISVGATAAGSGWVVAQQDPEGLDTTILVSIDGTTWRKVSTITGVTVQGLTHGPMGWVAVGDSAQTSSSLAGTVVYTSDDLVTWTRTAELEGRVRDVAVGGGRVVAVGDHAGGFVSEAGLVFSTPLIHVSTDGVDWTTDTYPLGEAGTAIGNRQPLGAVEFVEGLGFVLGAVHAVDDSDSDPFYLELFVSPDGLTWTTAGLGANSQGSVMSAGGMRGVSTDVALAAGDGILVQAAQPWVAPAQPDGLGDAPRVTGPIVIYDPATNVNLVACELCDPDGDVVDGTPFGKLPVSEMAFGDGTFLAIANSADSATVFRSHDARVWDQVGRLEGPVGGLAYGPLVSANGSSSTEPSDTGSTATTASVPSTGLGDAPAYSETAVSGSGCNPGSDVLSDGWWYGNARSPIQAGSSFDFDVACFYYGKIAARTAHDEDPVQYPDPSSIDDDVYVSNSDTTTRSVVVAPSADLRCIDPDPGDQRPCASPGVSWSVWVRMQGGVATKVIEQFRP